MVCSPFLILYGSETGTAQEIAEGIWRDSKRFGFNSSLMAMDEYDVSKLIYEPIIIFVCSTTGQGDNPNNMRKFWRFLLRKSLPPNSLSNSCIAVLGLGDSSYAKFNYAAKKLYRRLISLGARSLLDVGLCDDQHELGLDAVRGPWNEKLWTSIESLYPGLNEIRKNADFNSLLLRWKAIPSNEEPVKLTFPPGEPTERVNCLVTGNLRTTPEHHFQDVRLITLKPEKKEIHYAPGAVAYFRPCNSKDSVNNLITLVSGQVEEQFRLESIHLPLPDELKGKTLSLEDIAMTYWDLNAIPRRRVFEILAHVTSNELEKEKLEEFLSPGGLDELYTYCNRPRRTTLEVLADFPYATSGLGLDHLFEIFQPIRARAYSISSSLEYDGPIIQVLVAVVRYKTRLSTPRLGLATNWLATLSGSVVVAIKPPTLRFPENNPVVMVGPGTGVAPFRSYISQRIAISHEKGDILKPPIFLFFGSRYEKCDFHFGEEFLKWQSMGHFKLVTAFSRDQSKKIYVQDKIYEEGQNLLPLISNNEGYILVAGSSKDMPASVRNAFIRVLSDFGSMSNEKASAVVEKMEASGRYQEETWS